ncbi:hypothetical protein AVEN_163337-1, partial [Araneus ventricosus]
MKLQPSDLSPLANFRPQLLIPRGRVRGRKGARGGGKFRRAWAEEKDEE